MKYRKHEHKEKYKVMGADSETGNDRCEIIIAKNSYYAELIATSDMGMFVSTVERIKNHQYPSKFTDPEANKKAGAVMLRVGFWIVSGFIILGLLQLILDSSRPI